MKWLNDKKIWLLKNIDSTIISSLTNIDSSLSYADTILWVSDLNKNLNDNYEMYLSAKNTSYKNISENIYKESKSMYDELKSSNKDILKKYDDLQVLTNKLIYLYENIILVLDNSVISSSFSETTLSWFKSNIKVNQNIILWINQSIVNLKNTLVDLDNSIFDLENTISSTKINISSQKSSLEQALSIALSNLENTKISIWTNIDSVNWNQTLLENQLKSTIAMIKSTRDTVDNAVKIAQNQYDSTASKLDSSLANVKTQLDNISWQKKSVLQQIDNTIIKAPYNWLIIWKNIEIGTLVNPWTPIFSISDNNNKIIKTDLNSDNIKFIKVWQEVLISKNGNTLTWIISLVSSSNDNITKMYSVEISLQNNDFSSKVVLWDFVDIYLKKASGETLWQIVIPFTSLVTSTTWDFSVYLVGSWNILKSQTIKIAESNSYELLVTDWLKVGDRIVVSWTLNLSEGDEIEE